MLNTVVVVTSETLPGLAFAAVRFNAILAFWAAYVMTRPLGASFADWTGKNRHAGGIGIGDGTIGFILAALIITAVAYLTTSRSDQRASEPSEALEPALADEPA